MTIITSHYRSYTYIEKIIFLDCVFYFIFYIFIDRFVSPMLNIDSNLNNNNTNLYNVIIFKWVPII